MATLSGTALADAPAKTPPKDAKVDAPKEDPPEVKAARGVVVITRAGTTVGLGAVLAGDGRILSALSPLGSGNDLEARYADGTTVKLKLGHHDRGWDLAFLVPQSGKWSEGLIASSRDPIHENAKITSYAAASKSVTPTSTEISSHKMIIGGDDQHLDNALELGSRISPTNLGTPLVDEDGKVVGIIGRGCLPQEGDKPCIPVAFGVPVSAIKSFLKGVPADAVAPQPFLGIQGVAQQGTFARGVRVVSVAKNSPASTAKLRGDSSDGDMILGVAGEPVTSPEELSAAIKKHAIGEKVVLTLFTKEQLYKQVEVTLGSPPDTTATTTASTTPATLDSRGPAMSNGGVAPTPTPSPAKGTGKPLVDPFNNPM
ncbi:MAG: S1C family serine protease [Polyangiaceae bacterium]